VVVGLILLAAGLLPGCVRGPLDSMGRTPEETVHQFVAAVRKGDYREAEKFWDPKDLEEEDGRRFTWGKRGTYWNAAGEMKFDWAWHETPISKKAYFRDGFLVDSYELEFEGISKGYRWIYFRGKQNELLKVHRFFVREVDGKWTLH
jgi:hypothetical protein